MNQRLKIARILLTIPALFLAIVPPIVDLSESHVVNPLWIGHARLHTVWLLATNSIVSVIALTIMWRGLTGSVRTSLLLGGSLVTAVLGGFFVAALTRSAYGGALTDPNGVAITVGPFDANAAVFSMHMCLVVAAFVMVRKSE